MARRPAETMTEVRIDVSRYPGITDKFREAMKLSGAFSYVQVLSMPLTHTSSSSGETNC